ncbi:MAG TPA: YidC/Oxa1 family membrane protein insertase [Patescibacteria group bacterium]|nr:YidC/Oxa1 family membrane protein insertase [Patescibacteria group bacterium]
MNFLTAPLLQFLLFLYKMIGDFGGAIIIFTLILRFVLAPLSVPAIKSQKKMQKLKPELDKLKKLHGTDKTKLQQEQLKLYQLHKINPAAGCLPYILQFVVLIALYQVLNDFLHTKEVGGTAINTMFLGLDLSKPDRTFILPILSGVSQLALSLMVLPGAESHDLIPDNAKTKKLQVANKKEEDTQEMAESMQKQMVFMMPVVTGIAALNFPAGLAMYWVVSTLFSIVQQWILSGPGGLFLYTRNALQAVRRFGRR